MRAYTSASVSIGSLPVLPPTRSAGRRTLRKRPGRTSRMFGQVIAFWVCFVPLHQGTKPRGRPNASVPSPLRKCVEWARVETPGPRPWRTGADPDPGEAGRVDDAESGDSVTVRGPRSRRERRAGRAEEARTEDEAERRGVGGGDTVLKEFLGEGHRKVRARLRAKGIGVGKNSRSDGQRHDLTEARPHRIDP